MEEILRERLSELGVTVEYSSELADLEQDSAGVHAFLKTANGSERESFAYAIGCDGASSTVRKLTVIRFLGETDEMIMSGLRVGPRS